MTRVARLLWPRLQETPLELAVAVGAGSSAVVNMTTRVGELSIFAWLLYVTLLVGGIALFVGRYLDTASRRHTDAVAMRQFVASSLESMGCALLAGGFLFLIMRNLPRAEDASEVASYVLRFGCVSIGFAIRLYVIRRAVNAAQRIAREVNRG